ncbi:MAG: A/G-specific adenine glycosylase [Acidobacteriota bacterium]|nr:A/G-specific adenine glycosylase [Acidobacteriota bacterium]
MTKTSPTKLSGRGQKPPVAVAGRTSRVYASIRRALLAWFSANARVHPWRGTGDPYAVWVSEIMLQQTQIATATPYYQRFLDAFPTVSHLAQAPLERVLELWSGLGYYRRARHLHQAAQAVAQLPAAKFPKDYAGLRSLPGIGDYTAKAVLSIAFNQPYAVLDGNVARVVARLYSLRGNLHQPQFRNTVEAELGGMLSRQGPGNFNEAMMELGQTLCLPRAPLCPACPLSKWCAGYRSGNPEDFPLPRPRRAAESHYLAAALLRRGSRVAMVRGLADGLMDDLWNFPSTFGGSPGEALESLHEKLRRLTRAPFTVGEPLAEIRHGITYRAIKAQVYPIKTARPLRHASLHWFELEELPQAAISQLSRKIVQKIS